MTFNHENQESARTGKYVEVMALAQEAQTSISSSARAGRRCVSGIGESDDVAHQEGGNEAKKVISLFFHLKGCHAGPQCIGRGDAQAQDGKKIKIRKWRRLCHWAAWLPAALSSHIECATPLVRLWKALPVHLPQV